MVTELAEWADGDSAAMAQPALGPRASTAHRQSLPAVITRAPGTNTGTASLSAAVPTGVCHEAPPCWIHLIDSGRCSRGLLRKGNFLR